jgi:hypothetical protein
MHLIVRCIITIPLCIHFSGALCEYIVVSFTELACVIPQDKAKSTLGTFKTRKRQKWQWHRNNPHELITH